MITIFLLIFLITIILCVFTLIYFKSKGFINGTDIVLSAIFGFVFVIANIIFLKFFPKTIFKWINFIIIKIFDNADDGMMFLSMVSIFIYDAVVGSVIALLIIKIIKANCK